MYKLQVDGKKDVWRYDMRRFGCDGGQETAKGRYGELQIVLVTVSEPRGENGKVGGVKSESGVLGGKSMYIRGNEEQAYPLRDGELDREYVHQMTARVGRNITEFSRPW